MFLVGGLPNSIVLCIWNFQGVLLSADGVAGNLASDTAEAIMVSVQPEKYPVNHAKESIQPAMDIKETYKLRYVSSWIGATTLFIYSWELIFIFILIT